MYVVVAAAKVGVSSRAPVWGASINTEYKTLVAQFQVVPPCGGHPDRYAEADAGMEVSSRAPVGGASQVYEVVR